MIKKKKEDMEVIKGSTRKTLDSQLVEISERRALEKQVLTYSLLTGL